MNETDEKTHSNDKRSLSTHTGPLTEKLSKKLSQALKQVRHEQ